jgi:drug/metabolite transporter (DMT)-like permease
LPVFNIIPSFLLLHELPTAFGVAGILSTVVATYLLLTDARSLHTKFNMPVLFMVITVACTALGSTLDKVAIEASTPVFYSFVNIIGACVVFTVLSYVYGELHQLRHVKAVVWQLCLLGVVFGLAFVAFTIAFALGPTSYTLAIRSAGFLLAALWGVFVLHESVSAQKSVAIMLFIIGTLFLALA